MTLRIGLYVPTWPTPRGGPFPRWPEIEALARDAEALGVDTLWVADEPGSWECWTVLTAIAGVTSTVELGPLVACTRYRDPAVLATMVRAFDEVSGARLTLGLGAGAGAADPRWPRFGWDAAAYVSRFGEAVEIVVRLLREGSVTFDGEFYRIDAPDIGPVGPRPAGPPVWVAAGKPRTLEIAARWADAVNFAPGLTGADGIRTLTRELSAANDRVGRTRSIALTGWARIAPSTDGSVDRDREDTITGTPDQVVDRILELHAAGIEHLTCFIADGSDDHPFPRLTRASLDRFSGILESLRLRR